MHNTWIEDLDTGEMITDVTKISYIAAVNKPARLNIEILVDEIEIEDTVKVRRTKKIIS